MRMSEYCVGCMLEKKLEDVPEWATADAREEYRRRVRQAVEGCGDDSSPIISGRVSAIYRELFGPERDYADVKRRFNALMLGLEDALQASVAAAADPLERAVQYAMIGNFIDFAALKEVSEEELRRKLEGAAALSVDPRALDALRREAGAAHRLAYFTDNCGEIVADKVLIRQLRAMNPALEVTAIVRGLPVVNDATLEDARQVGLQEAAQRVIGNGCDLPGTVFSRISKQALAAADAADVLIAKGQANYEGMSGCGRNAFYIFMCKCRMFTERFGVPLYTGMLVRE